MRTILPALLLVAGFAAAEPLFMRDAGVIVPGGAVFELAGSWASSRGAFDSDGALLGFEATPGEALTRSLVLEARAGLPARLEARLSGGLVTQELKMDALDASGWGGAMVSRGSGPTDVLATLKWAPMKPGETAVGVEAGVRVPVATGPDRARTFYGRLGDGSWAFPAGLRLRQSKGPMAAYLEGFYVPVLSRRIGKWYGEALPAREDFRAGAEFSFAAGVEVAGEAVSWSVEMSRWAKGRDRGGNGAATAGMYPKAEAMALTPSVGIRTSPGSDLLLGVSLPLDGRNVYQMFAASAAVRRRL